MSSTLICYDGSPSSSRALEVAHHSLGRQRKILLDVWSAPERVHADSFGFDQHDGGPSYDRLCELLERQTQEILDDGVQRAAELGIEVQTRAERSRSSVWRTILDVADELDADLILAGTRGVTAVETGLLGSVSGELVRHSRRPVLIVPGADWAPRVVVGGGVQADRVL
ncbi:MAG: universal stress protein [Solirubrobacteraceae bacterium]